METSRLIKCLIRQNKWGRIVIPLLLSVPIFIAIYCLNVSEEDSTALPAVKAYDDNNPIHRHARYVDAVLDTLHKPLNNQDVSHPIYGVQALDKSFDDLNDIQLPTAISLGISALSSRADLPHHRDSLVDITDYEYLRISEQMTQSLPLLVPRAARLVGHIAKSFRDSLVVKGYTPYDLVVTSGLRSEEDLANLRKRNRNASAKSCHRYGTTFDISYVRFYDVQAGMEVSESKLKDILAEVLWEYRQRELCYVKYERRQACFHITAR